MRFFCWQKSAGSKTQRVSTRRQIYMRGFAPRKHPAPGLQPGLHRKTAFCFFSQCLQARFLPASDDSNLSPYIFLYRSHSLSSATSLYSGLTGQQSHARRNLFYRANLSLPAVNIITSFANPRRQNSKPIYKNNHKKTTKKRKPKLP